VKPEERSETKNAGSFPVAVVHMNPVLSVMADYGSGPYLWILRDGTADAPKIGPCIASYGYWPDDEFPGIAQDLKEDFDDWIMQFESYSGLPKFRWEFFHKRGLQLARRLKAQLGDRAIVRYVTPMEDPNHKKDEVTGIERE
jgi:hypothetical protein